ncbi:calcium-dependent phosphotriesterase [Atractiella rhizophila]|nr:calcium-dependent phosphotriesterase [Atractiella rhizophila]
MLFLQLVFLGAVSASWSPELTRRNNSGTQIIYFDHKANDALAADFPGRDQFSSYPNLTESQLPAIVVYNKAFEHILGSSPELFSIATNDDPNSFAHEAPVWIQETNEVFFCSNANPTSGQDPALQYVSKLSLDLTPDRQAPTSLINTNGGTNWKGKLLFCAQGRNEIAGELALVDPYPPYKKTTVVNNFYGRQFNSPNDVDIHPTSKAIFFTDPLYGFYQAFRPPQQFPVQIYRLDPDTGVVTAVADGFTDCNGLAFSPDGKTVYVADTGTVQGTGNGTVFRNPAFPATIYEYDVLPVSKGQRFANRRIFAYIDSGVPDGVKVDTNGNVYASCGDGVHVFSPDSVLLGKFLIGKTSANLAFAGHGRLIILAENEIFLAKLDAGGTLPVA